MTPGRCYTRPVRPGSTLSQLREGARRVSPADTLVRQRIEQIVENLGLHDRLGVSWPTLAPCRRRLFPSTPGPLAPPLPQHPRDETPASAARHGRHAMQHEAREGNQRATCSLASLRLIQEEQIEIAAVVIFRAGRLDRDRDLAQRPVTGEVRVPVVEALIGTVVARELDV